MKILRNALFVIVGMYLMNLGAFFVFQRSLLYFPDRNYVSLTQAHANPAFKEFPVKTEDGLALKAWYAPASGKRFTFVFFHGNADSLESASSVADPYIAAGYGFLVAEYRGYSGMPATPPKPASTPTAGPTSEPCLRRKSKAKTSSSSGIHSAPASPCRWRRNSMPAV